MLKSKRSHGERLNKDSWSEQDLNTEQEQMVSGDLAKPQKRAHLLTWEQWGSLSFVLQEADKETLVGSERNSYTET